MRKKTLALVTILSLSLLVSFFAILLPQKTQALNGSEFKAGRIIDDALFFNGNTMTASQIQAFLDAKMPTCDTNGSKSISYYYRADPIRIGDDRDTWVTTTRAVYGDRYQQYWNSLPADQKNPVSPDSNAPFVCLKDYGDISVPSKAPEDSLCNGVTAASNRTAAQVIDIVAASCGVSEKALIVLLQKEQGLISDDWPWGRQYTVATGYGCPDSGPNNSANCDSQYYGFFNQVYLAARVFKYYAKYPGSFNHLPNQTNYILYNPNTSCGGSNIYIENQATAGLYNYTPYQPNTAALNNLYGSGDGCSAYGNRNFWRMYNDWFGPTYSARAYIYPYDMTTDKTGEPGEIGFSLSVKPKSDVYIKYKVSSPSNARIIGNDTLKFTPEDWDKPRNHTLKVAGINNTGLVGNYRYWLVPEKPVSNDSRYSTLPAEFVGSVSMLQQDNYNPPNVYRLSSPSLNIHTFTASTIERDSLIDKGWNDEGAKFSYCYNGGQTIVSMIKDNERRLVAYGSTEYSELAAEGFSLNTPLFTSSNQGTVPVYWLYDEANNRHLYSTNPNEGSAQGFVSNGIVFHGCDPVDQKVVYRMVNPNNGDHLFTTSSIERYYATNKYGYQYENLGFYICSSGDKNIYRLVNTETGDHLLTASEPERNTAINKYNYRDEGIAFKVCSDGTRKVYRLANTKNGDHHYTTSEVERQNAINKYNYRDEGVAFTTR